MQDNDNGEGDEMASGLGLAERDLLLERLRATPDAPPPRAVWERIAEQAGAEGLFAEQRATPSRAWFAGAGLAAALAIAVLYLPQPPESVDDAFPTEPAYVDATDGQNLAALMVQSQVLERNLQALPAKPSLMRAGTAATISDLEDRIAAIDHVLNAPDAGLSEEDTRLYWRERVRLMESLVQLRYAQARRSSL